MTSYVTFCPKKLQTGTGMPSYFFDIYGCSLAVKDTRGQLLADAEEANTRASQLLRDIARKLLCAGEPLVAIVVARNDKGEHLTLALRVRTVGGLSS